MIIYFSFRGIILFGNYFFSIFSWVNNFRMINYFAFLSLNIQLLLNHMFLRLDVSFSNCCTSRNCNWNGSSHSLLIDNGIILNFLSVNRSTYFFSSDDWSLNKSLFNDRLRNDFFGNNRLWNNLSLNDGLRNDFLRLNDLWSGIQNLFWWTHTYKGLSSYFCTSLNHLSF